MRCCIQRLRPPRTACAPRLKRHDAATGHAKHIVFDGQGIDTCGFGLGLSRGGLGDLRALWGLLLTHESHDANLLLKLVLDRRLGALSCALGKLVGHTL